MASHFGLSVLKKCRYQLQNRQIDRSLACSFVQGKAIPTDDQQGKIAVMKKEANIQPMQREGSRKRKRPKGPNPLSCKKSKKMPQVGIQTSSEGSRRRKRKRHNNDKKSE